MDYREKPLLLVIFGITGDLSQRKLLPALFNLALKNELPSTVRIVGISRKKVHVSEIYDKLRKDVHPEQEHTVDELVTNTEMIQMDMDERSEYEVLLKRLEQISEEMGNGISRLYYLSIPATAFVPIVRHLGQTGHNEPLREDADRPRLLVEKPFGYDMASAHKLISAVDEHFGEQQTFRIDHYLAKETAQNILTFRFQNPLFRTIWNTRHIDVIKIVAYETIGIENRAAFYEQTGALRDIIQSHLIQLLALVAMEHPGKFDSMNIHKAKLRLLDSIEAIGHNEVATCAKRGQYETYQKEVGHPSNVETYASLHLRIDNEQWRGVDVILETGKALSEKLTQVEICFRRTDESDSTNKLTFRIQPHEGITLQLHAKQPGLQNETDIVEMDFDYARSFGATSEAYERVIIDAIRGDQSLFASAAEVLSAWRVVEEVLKAWEKNETELLSYEVGTPPEQL